MTDLRHLRRRMLEVAFKAGEGHLPSSFSILELLWVLHSRVMTPECRCVLSKGHGALALYVVLEELKRIPSEWLDRYCTEGAELLGHPERRPECGIEATTGSLGHGAPMSIGMGLAKKIKRESGRIYCLLGDQECSEGSVYEAALLATKFKLDNLVWLIDNNWSAQNSLPMDSIGAKFMAFNWLVAECSGHSQDSIEHAIKSRVEWTAGQPLCIVAATVKGFGVKAFEREPQVWHHRVPQHTEYEAMMVELS